MRVTTYKNVYIHPTAVIYPGAELGENSYIGPYSVIESDVKLGRNCKLISHVVICGKVRIGDNNIFYPFTVIGGEPQDKKYKGEETEIIIGNNNIFREGVTVNRGTKTGIGKTVIGNNNMFMSYTHIAHDCIISDNITVANGVHFAGHCIVEEGVVFGGVVGVGQFVRIGKYGMIAAGSMVERNTPPFCLIGGDRAKPRGINVVGLKRAGFSPQEIKELKLIYRKIYIKKNCNLLEEIKKLKEIVKSNCGRELIAFIEKNRVIV